MIREAEVEKWTGKPGETSPWRAIWAIARRAIQGNLGKAGLYDTPLGYLEPTSEGTARRTDDRHLAVPGTAATVSCGDDVDDLPQNIRICPSYCAGWPMCIRMHNGGYVRASTVPYLAQADVAAVKTAPVWGVQIWSMSSGCVTDRKQCRQRLAAVVFCRQGTAARGSETRLTTDTADWNQREPLSRSARP
jgi:hypothetical protein